VACVQHIPICVLVRPNSGVSNRIARAIVYANFIDRFGSQWIFIADSRSTLKEMRGGQLQIENESFSEIPTEITSVEGR
jgi:hypothetical protein